MKDKLISVIFVHFQLYISIRKIQNYQILHLTPLIVVKISNLYNLVSLDNFISSYYSQYCSYLTIVDSHILLA